MHISRSDAQKILYRASTFFLSVSAFLSNHLDTAKSPELSDVVSLESYDDSSEEENLPEAIRLARAREKRFQVCRCCY